MVRSQTKNTPTSLHKDFGVSISSSGISIVLSVWATYIKQYIETGGM